MYSILGRQKNRNSKTQPPHLENDYTGTICLMKWLWNLEPTEGSRFPEQGSAPITTAATLLQSWHQCRWCCTCDKESLLYTAWKPLSPIGTLSSNVRDQNSPQWLLLIPEHKSKVLGVITGLPPCPKSPPLWLKRVLGTGPKIPNPAFCFSPPFGSQTLTMKTFSPSHLAFQSNIP